jgi:hypothetical protein
MGAVKVSREPVGELLGAEQAGRLDDRAVAVYPLGLHRVEPGTLDGQGAREDLRTALLLLDAAIVRTHASAHPLGCVPGGVIPAHKPHAPARLPQPGGVPRQELLCDGAHRSATDKAHPHPLVLLHLAEQHASIGQSLWVGIGLGHRLLDEAQRPSGSIRPGAQVRTSQPTPPGLIGTSQRPARVPLGQSAQAVTLPFFRTYRGSGLLIPCLARIQLLPSRSKVWRMVSPLTRRATTPSATLTSAATASVQRLVDLPQSRGSRGSRGLRCRGASTHSTCSRPKTKCVRLAREERVCTHVSPTALRAYSTSIEHGLVVAAALLGDTRRPLATSAGHQDHARPSTLPRH